MSENEESLPNSDKNQPLAFIDKIKGEHVILTVILVGAVYMIFTWTRCSLKNLREKWKKFRTGRKANKVKAKKESCKKSRKVNLASCCEDADERPSCWSMKSNLSQEKMLSRHRSSGDRLQIYT